MGVGAYIDGVVGAGVTKHGRPSTVACDRSGSDLGTNPEDHIGFELSF